MWRYPPEVHAFIAGNVQGTTTKDLVNLVNAEFGPLFSESTMRSYKTNHTLKSGTPTGLPAGRPTEMYPAEVRKFIQAKHSGVGPKEMAILLNNELGTAYTHGQLKGYYGNHNINSGVNGWFPKGQISHRCFQKGERVSPATEFKPGRMPHNYKPVGTERISKDGYLEIKIADPKKWRGKHLIVWEGAHGPVPKGHAVIFADGNKRNFALDNLLLVTRAQLAMLNKYRLIQGDADLTKTGIKIADLVLKIGERKKS